MIYYKINYKTEKCNLGCNFITYWKNNAYIYYYIITRIIHIYKEYFSFNFGTEILVNIFLYKDMFSGKKCNNVIICSNSLTTGKL